LVPERLQPPAAAVLVAAVSQPESRRRPRRAGVLRSLPALPRLPHLQVDFPTAHHRRADRGGRRGLADLPVTAAGELPADRPRSGRFRSRGFADALAAGHGRERPAMEREGGGSVMTQISPRSLARTAGALYLINIIGGAFAIGVVPGMLFVAGDPAATAHNIASHELLYRLGIAAHVVIVMTNVAMAVIFYELFKIVDRRLALLMAFFTLVATAIESAGLLNQFTPLMVLRDSSYSNTNTAGQGQALAYY